MNFHKLQHLCDDLKNMNCHLSMITAFSFENLLGKIKRSLRTGHRALTQICNRLKEEYMILDKKVTLPKLLNIKKKNTKRPENLLKIKFEYYFLTTKQPNNTVLINENVCFFY